MYTIYVTLINITGRLDIVSDFVSTLFGRLPLEEEEDSIILLV